MQSSKTHPFFQPRGCNFTIEAPAVTVGGGSQLGDLYEELDKINQTVVGGNSKTVSVGGYLTGGGHSILAPRYGLGADQVLEMEVVTPMGDIVVANECQNQDLFWAMRGVSEFTQVFKYKYFLIDSSGGWFDFWGHDLRHARHTSVTTSGGDGYGPTYIRP